MSGPELSTRPAGGLRSGRAGTQQTSGWSGRAEARGDIRGQSLSIAGGFGRFSGEMNESLLPTTGVPPARVTYCGNVHAAETLDAWLATLPRFAARVAAGRVPFDLGVWWPAPVAAELARSAPAQRRVAVALAEHGLRLATVNAFPYRGFHDASVKTAVYRPDWASAARVTFSLDVAHAAVALAPAGSEIAISTLPLGFGGGHIGDMRENLARVAREYAALAASSGVRCVLAIEPEPHCLVETASEALACIAAIRDEFGDDPDLRDHLGVCVDLCHLAVVGEDPLAVLAQARRAQVPVPKIQVSSCLEVRGPDGLAQLLAWTSRATCTRRWGTAIRN